MQKRVAVKKQQNSPHEAIEFLTNLPQDPPVHPLVQVYTVPDDDRRKELRGSLGCRVAESAGQLKSEFLFRKKNVRRRNLKFAQPPRSRVVLRLALSL